MKKKGCLIPILIVLVGLVVLFIVMVRMGLRDSPKKDNDTSSSQNTTNSIMQEYIETLTDEQAKQVDAVLTECGIENISSVTHDELLDNAHEKNETGYRIFCDRADNVILYLDKNMKVYQIVYEDNKLYTKGKVKATLQDFTFSTSEATQYQVTCQEEVKAILKSPKSADFPDIMKWGFSKTKKKIIVQGYVDAEIRSIFQFTFDKKTNKITSFIFDGQEQIQK